MDSHAMSFSERDAFRVQVAAVVAQQAALVEQEIELGDVHDRLLARIDASIDDLRSVEKQIHRLHAALERMKDALEPTHQLRAFAA